jgi:hypothetical protein
MACVARCWASVVPLLSTMAGNFTPVHGMLLVYAAQALWKPTMPIKVPQSATFNVPGLLTRRSWSADGSTFGTSRVTKAIACTLDPSRQA